MIEVECHIAIKKDGNRFLAANRTQLLNAIVQHGSLRAAAQKLKISYHHAWNMMDDMNRLAPEPLIIMQRGGANGGGAQLSVYGQNILHEFKLIEAQVNKLVHQINIEINL